VCVNTTKRAMEIISLWGSRCASTKMSQKWTDFWHYDRVTPWRKP